MEAGETASDPARVPERPHCKVRCAPPFPVRSSKWRVSAKPPGAAYASPRRTSNAAVPAAQCLPNASEPAKPPLDGGRCIRRSSRTTAACCACPPSTRSITRSAATRRASRPCSCTAAPAPAATIAPAAFSIRTPIASCCSTSAAAAAAGRTPAWSTTPPGTWSRTWSSCASTSASNAGWCSAARGARRSASPTRRRIPSASASWSCAASSCCRSSSCAGSTRKAPARSSPITGRTTSPRFRRQERGDLIQAFYKRLTSDDRATRVAAARAWSVWEAATSYLHVNEENLHKWGEEDFAIAVARIECHYFVNRGFLESEDQLLRNVTSDPQASRRVIVQGRYDVVCPMQTAWALHRAWPEADLRIVPDAGHSAFEPGNTHELISATDRFR